MRSGPLRIAAHNGAREFGGGEKWTLLLLRGLQERGHAVHLFCRDDAMVTRARAHHVPASLGRLGGHLMLPDALRLAGALRRFRPDALLVTTYKKIWLAGMAAQWARVPRVVARIGLSSDLPDRHWSYRLALQRWTDAVLVNADGIRTDFVRQLPDVDAGRIATVYDGVTIEAGRWSRARAREALDLPSDVPVVGTVTRLSRQKRLDRMLDALELMPGVHLAIAGVGELEAELRERARSPGLEGRVHFLGFQEDVARVLAALDVFVLSSDKEGMANAMLEALAAGVPVVSTRVSGAEEALAPEEGAAPGAVVGFDAGEIAEAVRPILSDGALREAMAAEARRRAATRFAFPAMLDAWEHVLAGGDPAAVHQGASAARP